MMTPEFIYLTHAVLHPSPFQPRRVFSSEHLHDLAVSIKEHGIIEPLIVRKKMDDYYEIIAGERRWRAAKSTGLSSIPCLIRDYSDSEAAVLSIIENIQRDNLHVLEEASAYRRLMHEFHYQQDAIATQVGKSRSHVANLLRLLTLPSSIQEKIIQESISFGHARALIGLDESQQHYFISLIKDKAWSVRQLEQAIKVIKKEPSSLQKMDESWGHFESKLSLQLGAPVSLEYENAPMGWLKIKFFDHETLQGLLEKLGLSYD